MTCGRDSQEEQGMKKIDSWWLRCKVVHLSLWLQIGVWAPFSIRVGKKGTVVHLPLGFQKGGWAHMC